MAGSRRRKQIKEALRLLLPQVSLHDFAAIEDKADAGHLRHLPASIAAKQAATAYIRHTYTEYDQYLAEGYEPDAARFFVIDTMNETLAKWGSTFEILQDN